MPSVDTRFSVPHRHPCAGVTKFRWTGHWRWHKRISTIASVPPVSPNIRSQVKGTPLAEKLDPKTRHPQHVRDQGNTMIERVPYSHHKIKVCSQSLTEDRWLPLALIWKSVGSKDLLDTVWGEPTEICKSYKESDSIALRKAKRWIDQNR